MTPELKQFRDLTIDDFERHAVWVGVHTVDYGEPWYDDTDEETFRPWLASMPVDPSEGMFLLRASFRLANGTQLNGFVTPAFPEDTLGTVQPQMFAAGLRHMFWFGMFPPPPEAKAALYTALAAEPREVFPIQFQAGHGLCRVPTAGSVNGFVYSPDLRNHQIET